MVSYRLLPPDHREPHGATLRSGVENELRNQLIAVQENLFNSIKSRQVYWGATPGLHAKHNMQISEARVGNTTSRLLCKRNSHDSLTVLAVLPAQHRDKPPLLFRSSPLSQSMHYTPFFTPPFLLLPFFTPYLPSFPPFYLYQTLCFLGDTHRWK